jgi:hypothetical protein
MLTINLGSPSRNHNCLHAAFLHLFCSLIVGSEMHQSIPSSQNSGPVFEQENARCNSGLVVFLCKTSDSLLEIRERL